MNEPIYNEYSKKDIIPILQTTLEDGIISADSVLDTIMATKRQQIRNMHPYAITPPKADRGRWQTRYRDVDGNYKNIKAQTENKLLDNLIPLYLSNEHIDNLTFHGLYEEWLDYKKDVTSSPNTIKRHGQHYRKYFEDSMLHTMKVWKIDELILETECNRIVKEFDLARKEWGNVKTILNGMFGYAVRKKYLHENIMDHVVIHVKFRQVVKKTGKTETYSTDELKELNHLHIVREEVRNQDTNTYEVVEHTKTNRDRFVVLVPKTVALLQKLDRTDGYIFTRNRERLTSRQIAYVLEKYAETKGISTKSTHKMRKTFASNLNAAGVPLSTTFQTHKSPKSLDFTWVLKKSNSKIELGFFCISIIIET